MIILSSISRKNRIPVKPYKNWVTEIISSQHNLIQLQEVFYQITYHLNNQRTTPSLKCQRQCSYQTHISMRYSQTVSIFNLKKTWFRLLISFRFQFLLPMRRINQHKITLRYILISQRWLILQQPQQITLIQLNRLWSSKLL